MPEIRYLAPSKKRAITANVMALFYAGFNFYLKNKLLYMFWTRFPDKFVGPGYSTCPGKVRLRDTNFV